MADLDYQKGMVACQRGDYHQGVVALERSVANNAAAAFNLGEFYYSGMGVAVDYSKSFEYYFKAVKAPRTGRYALPEENYVVAVSNLTGLLNYHKVPPHDEGYAWLERCAKSTSSKPLLAIVSFCLGLRSYDAGDREKAAKHYRLAARQGRTGNAAGDEAVAQAVDNLDSLATRLTPEKFVEGLVGTLDGSVTVKEGAGLEPRIPLPTCAGCGKTDASLVKCGRCKAMYYCNRDCQLKDFPQHKAGCKAKAAARATSTTG